MKGKNSMNLNHTTVVEAIQMWVDAKFKTGHAPKVVSVKATGMYGGGFDIELEEKPSDQQEMKLD